MTRRDSLAYVAPRSDAHCGLWLDRFATDHSSLAAAAHFAGTLGTVRVPSGYPAFFARWQEALSDLPEIRTTAAIVRGRMAVGLGAESVHETSIALHRTYGVPYIPGSALKGLAAAVARKRLIDPAWHKADGEAYRILFGEVEEAGFVTFHDALWMPPADVAAPLLLPLAADVMTVHHPRYYGSQRSAPTEWDDPTPIPFLTATGSYWIALTGPPHWTEAALDLLALGLDEMGIGAKTAAGYGRMTVDWTPKRLKFAAPVAPAGEISPASVAPPKAPDPPNWNALLTGLGHGRDAQGVERIFAAVGAAARPEAARRIIERLTPKELKKQKDKKWVQDLLAAVEGAGSPDEGS